MNTYAEVHLRADDEAALTAALLAIPGFVTDEDGAPHATGHGIAINIIGGLHGAAGEPLPGWHANLRIKADHPDRTAIEAALAAFVVTPENPKVVWA